ncbi:MAG: pyruvate dehydrogenase (acetyl-transferring) E1 component subunit alpha, partial [Nitrospiraceae bacterium]
MDREDLFSLYRQMLLIRRFEEKSAEMYALAKIAGFLHLY